jgi:hypothetical protein
LVGRAQRRRAADDSLQSRAARTGLDADVRADRFADQFNATLLSFAQAGAGLAGSSSSRVTPDNTDKAPAPELLMPPVPDEGNQPGLPGAPKVNPEAAPMSSADADDTSSALPGTPAAVRQACDACFSDGGWTPAAATREEVATLVAPSEWAATPFEAAAGFMFTLSLGGAWGLAGQQTRRRWHLRLR